MQVCPKCGHHFIGASNKGQNYLNPYEKRILEMTIAGKTTGAIARALLAEGVKGPYAKKHGYSSPDTAVACTVSAILRILKKNNLEPIFKSREHIRQYEKARRDYAFCLRKEGLIYREIGIRLGVSSSRAREIVAKREREIWREQNAQDCN